VLSNPRPNPRPRVLCVDDDEDSRVMLAALLKLALVEARTTGTAAEALLLMKTEHFDLYVLDAWLPEVNGFELCRQMRAFDPRIPILFFSGAVHKTDKQKGIEAGADAYVAKPDIRELLESIKQFTSDVERTEISAWREVRPVSGLTVQAHGTG